MRSIRIRFANNEGSVDLQTLPNECPFCYFAISPIVQLGGLRNISNTYILDVTCKCTNDRCGLPFSAEYVNFGPYYKLERILIPNNLKSSSFPPLVEVISPDFVQIYNQAEYAEQTQLDKIAGMGYRKSLEFLVKDYLIQQNSADAEDIKKIMLGPAIKKINDKRIKDIAERATWLGNDETHYVRRWIDKDVSDLKALIKLVVHFIDADLLYQETIASMTK